MGYFEYIQSAFILLFDHFLDSWAEICQFFSLLFLENLGYHEDTLKLIDLYIQDSYDKDFKS